MQRARYLRRELCLLALLSACSLLTNLAGPTTCEDGAPTRCEGSQRVFCEGGFEFREDCGDLACNAQANQCGVCGDGVKASAEECDGSVEGQTCQSQGFDSGALLCSGDCTFDTSGCFNFVCGNGIIEGNEQCDDFNNLNGDGCSSACVTEFCGDGVANNGEACDDNNAVEDDGCDSNCTLPSCGNSILDPSTEECDDGNGINGDGCENDCSLPACGNAILDDGELCYAIADKGAKSVVSADFDGDAKLDLAVANQTDNTITILQNQGGAQFIPRQIIAVGAPSFIAEGDFNGDSKPDLVTADTVSILKNQGAGAFSTQTISPTTDQPVSIVAGDFNFDGKIDLVTSSFTTRSISLLINQGNAFAAPIIFGVGDKPLGLAAGDLDGDGAPEIVVVNSGEDTVQVISAAP